MNIIPKHSIFGENKYPYKVPYWNKYQMKKEKYRKTLAHWSICSQVYRTQSFEDNKVYYFKKKFIYMDP